VIIAAVLAFAGALVRIDELFPVALAAVVLVGTALLWGRLRPWKMEGRRYLPVSRVPQGTPAQVELSVTNLGRRPSPVLAARDPFDGGRRFARFALSPLQPGATVTARYRVPTNQRGLFSIGPMEFRCSDPFGLSAANRISGGTSTLCVHPAFDRLAPLELAHAGSEGAQRGTTRPTSHGEEFYALREYQLGDDLRRVHWASSARADRLMIREDQEPTSSRLLLVGDLRRFVHTSASFERTLSILASLADSGLRGNHSVLVACTGSKDSGWGEGPVHALAILDLLAGAQPDSEGKATALRRCIWERAPEASTVIVVTTDGVIASDLTESAAPHGAFVVLVERTAKAGAGNATLPWPVVSVPMGLPFGTAWSAAGKLATK